MAVCPICYWIGVKCPQLCLATVSLWYGAYVQCSRANVLAPWSQCDSMFVQVGGGSVSVLAKAGYMRLDHMSHALVHLCFERL